jgi:beta-galactosidase
MPRLTRRDLLKSTLAASLGGAALTTLPTRAAAARALAVPGGRERLLLDPNWRFAFGHASNPAYDFGFGGGNDWDKVGEFLDSSAADFDASAWRTVDLPHDWAVELPFENAEELKEHGYKPIGRNYPTTSIGWYRRVFQIPESDLGRRLFLEFDGVYRDAIVALNGHFLGRNLSGYSPFRFDITDYVGYGGANVLVVRANATEREGWFYEGAGIYRHAWLTKTHPVHIPAGSTFVTSEVHGAEDQGSGFRVQGPGATVTVRAEIANDSDDALPCHAVATILDAAGTTVATARTAVLPVPAWERRAITLRLNVPRPELWSLESPHLYRLALSVALDSEPGAPVAGAPLHSTPVHRYAGAQDGAVDEEVTPFGIRAIRFDAEQGFFLNGRHVLIQGTCNHQDHAGVGAALPDRLQAYRVERLKAFGCNAYRTSHNPPTAELLDACDRLGMLVLDETRLFASVEEGLSQLERLIRRDRNHPSVIAWSLENEEWFVQGNDRGGRIAATMLRLARRLDPTRPVTAAMNGGWGSRVTELMDVQGFNYENRREPARDVDAIHRQFPGKPMWGTEVASTVSTRGIYTNDAVRGYLSAYDRNKPEWGALAEEWWPRYAARAWLAGGFVWTGFDYRGEPTPYAWPCINSHFGILDTCGFPKDLFYYYKAWWGTEPVLHLFPHWNWQGREGRDVEVWCHSNLDRVELYLNGTSLGAKDVPRNGHVAWMVPYAPGTLEARGFKNNARMLTEMRRTTGAPEWVALRPDREGIDANGEDVCVVAVEIHDASGLVVPTADNAVTFRVTGTGKLIGVGNGDPSSHESDKGDTRRAFNGLCSCWREPPRRRAYGAATATGEGQ